jgi:hypothetical protein
VGREINIHVLPAGEFVAKAFHGGHDSQQFEFRGVQLVRQGLDIGSDLHDLVLIVATGLSDRAGC